MRKSATVGSTPSGTIKDSAAALTETPNPMDNCWKTHGPYCAQRQSGRDQQADRHVRVHQRETAQECGATDHERQQRRQIAERGAPAELTLRLSMAPGTSE